MCDYIGLQAHQLHLSQSCKASSALSPFAQALMRALYVIMLGSSPFRCISTKNCKIFPA